MEISIAQKLEALMALQKIDSQLDEIVKMRGDLPNEVRDIEDELAGYAVRKNKIEAEIVEMQSEIGRYKISAKDAEKHIKKYTEQQNNVRNDREFAAIAKEIEALQLDVQIADKKSKEAVYRIEFKQTEIGSMAQEIEERHKDLTNKKAELNSLILSSQEHETQLTEERQLALRQVEERLIYSYNRIRINSRNGLAVVQVKRNACGGCFNMVPPQRQADIKDRKKIIVCEFCGRILAGVDVVEEAPAKGK